MDIKNSTKQKAGQALIELTIGLVAVVVVVAMMLQINMYSFEHTMTVVKARAAMAEAMTGAGTGAGAASFLSDWETGPDKHDYSEDDIAKAGSTIGFTDALDAALSVTNENGEVRLADLLESLSGEPTSNRIVSVVDSYETGLINNFDIMEIEVTGEPVPLFPIIQKLVYTAEEIIPTHKIYMPWIIDADL